MMALLIGAYVVLMAVVILLITRLSSASHKVKVAETHQQEAVAEALKTNDLVTKLNSRVDGLQEERDGLQEGYARKTKKAFDLQADLDKLHADLAGPDDVDTKAIAEITGASTRDVRHNLANDLWPGRKVYDPGRKTWVMTRADAEKAADTMKDSA